MNHISDKEMFFFVIKEQLSTERRQEIKEHIKICSLCKEHKKLVETVEKELEKELEKPPTEWDKKIAKKIISQGKNKNNKK